MPPESTGGSAEMSQRIAVYVYSADLISQAGVAAQLRGRPEAYVVEQHAIDDAAVAVVVVERIDDELVRLVRAIQRNGCPKVAVVATDPSTDGDLVAASGISAVLRRSEVTPELLASTVVAIDAGRQLATVASHAPTPCGPALSGRFNERERAVLALLADGCDTQEIAERLYYSERTIKGIIHDITSRLNLRNRSHAVAYAIKVGAV
jgi:DNA-binding NarL/FixJ family response regulator